MNSNINIGHSIENAQTITGMKSVEVARQLGVSKQLFRYYRKSEDISVSHAIKLTNIFNLSMPEFIKLGEKDPVTFKNDLIAEIDEELQTSSEFTYSNNR